MAEGPVDIFRASLKRCLATPKFLLDFYELFMASDEAIRQKFANTDFQRQMRVLADSLYLMAIAAESRTDAFAWKELGRLGEHHSRAGLDIDPIHYETWLDCLIAAAKKHDPEFTKDVGQAWRTALGPGIEHLRSKY